MSLIEILQRNTRMGREQHDADLLDAESSKLEEYNAIVRRKAMEAIEALALVLPGELFTEDRLIRNTKLLAPGSHGGAILTKPHTDLWAAGPGAYITKRVVIEQDAVLDGLVISTTDLTAGSDECVTVRAGATVVFRGCTFERPTDSTSSMVVVESTAKATLFGCVFRGSGTTSSRVVAHPVGAATDVQIAFCYNSTVNTLGVAADVTMTGNH
jgi:hypothetical protein